MFLVADIATTMRWYSAKLGFTAQATPLSPPHFFCILRRDNVSIFLQQLDGYRKPDLYDQREGGVWNVYIHTHGVRELFESLSRLDDDHRTAVPSTVRADRVRGQGSERVRACLC